MRFDLVDLQLFIAVAETRSITNGALRVHLALASASERIKGLEAAFGVIAAQARPPRRRTDRRPAKACSIMPGSCIHNVEAMRGDLAAFSRGVKATVRLLANTSGLSEYLPKALAAFLQPASAHHDRRRGARKRRHRERAIATGAADLGLAAEHALPDSVERILFSEDRLMLVASRAGELANRRQIDFREVAGARLCRPDRLDRAAAHVTGTPHGSARACAFARG